MSPVPKKNSLRDLMAQKQAARIFCLTLLEKYGQAVQKQDGHLYRLALRTKDGRPPFEEHCRGLLVQPGIDALQYSADACPRATGLVAPQGGESLFVPHVLHPQVEIPQFQKFAPGQKNCNF